MTERWEMDKQIVGPVIELAAKVKAALEREDLDVAKPWGHFYIKRVELAYYDGPEAQETVGWLVPDEDDGKTYDFYTAARAADD